MANKITYEDKISLYDDETILNENKVTANDMNEIKQKVNDNADELDNTIENISNLQAELEETQAETERLRSDLNLSTATVKGSGESVTLKGTSGARFKKLGISGNSWQESRSGKNKFNYTEASNTDNTTVTQYRIYEINGLEANAQYNINKLSFNSALSDQYCYLWSAPNYSEATRKVTLAGPTTYFNKNNFTANAEGKMYLAIYPTNTQTWQDLIQYFKKAQIETGTTETSYEPYTRSDKQVLTQTIHKK